MRYTLLLGLLWLLAGTATGQQQAPRFADFPVNEASYHGPPAAPKLKPGTAAWRFRTRIREGAKQQPNLAGHYVLWAWGCGSGCISYAVIDLKTGAVHYDEATVSWPSNSPETRLPLEVRPNSSLVVFRGWLNEQEPNKTHYFQFLNGRLVPVR